MQPEEDSPNGDELIVTETPDTPIVAREIVHTAAGELPDGVEFGGPEDDGRVVKVATFTIEHLASAPYHVAQHGECVLGPWIRVRCDDPIVKYEGAVNDGGAAALGERIHAAFGVADEYVTDGGRESEDGSNDPEYGDVKHDPIDRAEYDSQH